MTPEEALVIAEKSLEEFEFIPEAYDYAYTKACAAALEKQIQKKAVDTFTCATPGRAVIYGHCPTCGAFVDSDAYNFCLKCGQALKWREEFTEPELEVIDLSAEDVVTASAEDMDDDKPGHGYGDENHNHKHWKDGV